MVRRGNHAISGLFVFLLLGIFAVLSVLMVLMGAQVYRGVTLRAERHNGARLVPAIVRQTVRGGDEAGMLEVRTEDGIPVLCVIDEYDGERYLSRLYSWEGQLCASYTDEESDFDPEDGEPLCPAQDFRPSLADGRLAVSWMDEVGTAQEIDVLLYAAKEARL